MHNYQSRSKQGFTLIELSIVIVIIGLIVTGVTAGKSLVKSAKIRAQASDLQAYSSSFNAFSTQYDAIAGDMRDASTFWDGVTDGNGNGYIDATADIEPDTATAEQFTLFQHLSSAKLISGTYNNTYVLNFGYPNLKIDPTKGMMAGHCICGSFDGNYLG